MADRNEAAKKFRELIGRPAIPSSVPLRPSAIIMPHEGGEDRKQNFGGTAHGKNGDVITVNILAMLKQQRIDNRSVSIHNFDLRPAPLPVGELKGLLAGLADLFAPHKRQVAPLVRVGEQLSTKDKRVLSLARSFDTAVEEGTQVMKTGILADMVTNITSSFLRTQKAEHQASLDFAMGRQSSRPLREIAIPPIQSHPNSVAVAMHHGKGGGHRTNARDGYASTEAWGEESVGMSIGTTSGK